MLSQTHLLLNSKCIGAQYYIIFFKTELNAVFLLVFHLGGLMLNEDDTMMPVSVGISLIGSCPEKLCLSSAQE